MKFVVEMPLANPRTAFGRERAADSLRRRRTRLRAWLGYCVIAAAQFLSRSV